MSNGRTICTVCNYVYDAAFETLADEWSCPECGSPKDMFQPCSCVSWPIFEQTCVAHHHDLETNAEIRATTQGAIDKTTSVGELVAQRPLRACVLEQYGIDYCCGGKITLENACRNKGVDVQDVLNKLFEADSKDEGVRTDWTTARLKDLIDHIITTYHVPLRNELSRIAQLAEKVARVHGDNHAEMIEVRDVFTRFSAQLELHMQKEEMVLFPGIVSMETTGTPQIFGCGGSIEHPIQMMNQEHDDAGEALCLLRKLTADYTPPADACTTFKVLLCSLAQLESDMHQHVHKENNILFPRALGLCQPALSAR